ncbi:MAG: hypothetical protein WDN30_05405 [Pararobbsia sp.]
MLVLPGLTVGNQCLALARSLPGRRERIDRRAKSRNAPDFGARTWMENGVDHGERTRMPYKP